MLGLQYSPFNLAILSQRATLAALCNRLLLLCLHTSTIRSARPPRTLEELLVWRLVQSHRLGSASHFSILPTTHLARFHCDCVRCSLREMSNQCVEALNGRYVP
jgi:hypothetical protein